MVGSRCNRVRYRRLTTGLLSIGITFLSSFTVAQTLEISTSETSYKCDEEIVVDQPIRLTV